jgi:hypothetical protein
MSVYIRARLNQQAPKGVAPVVETYPPKAGRAEDRLETRLQKLFISMGVPASEGKTSGAEVSPRSSISTSGRSGACPHGATSCFSE